MRQSLWYLLACLGLLVAGDTSIKAMRSSAVPTIVDEPAEFAQAARNRPPLRQRRQKPKAPLKTESAWLTPQELTTIPEGIEPTNGAPENSPQPTSSKPPLSPRGHRRSGSIDLGRHAVAGSATTPQESVAPETSSRILMNISNALPRNIIIRSIYTSAPSAKGLPPLAPVNIDQQCGLGRHLIKTQSFITRGRGNFKQSLALKSVQFIDPQDNTLIKELDAATLAQPKKLSNIRLGVEGEKPPRSPHPSTGKGRHAPRMKKGKEPAKLEKILPTPPEDIE